MRSEKKGFTLIELLVVTVVLATLMGLVFRLAGMGDDTSKKSKTIQRIQKVEFALSAYYAAFGSYPPVKLHGVRDIYRERYSNDIQSMETGDDQTGKLEWERVRAACRSQPIAAEFPYCYDKWKDYFSELSKGYGPLNNECSGSDKGRTADWRVVHIFKFGVLSYLLPRYLFMLDGRDEYYDNCKQWTDNNRLGAIYDFDTGAPRFSTWQQMLKDMKTGEYWSENATPVGRTAAAVTNMTSQAVCARWMPTLEGLICHAGRYPVFGTILRDSEHNDRSEADGYDGYYTSGDGRGGQKYALNYYTIVDGWGYELYYYSPTPYQSYRLWSAGPNHKTFAPWVELSKLPSNQRETAGRWMADDIVHLNN